MAIDLIGSQPPAIHQPRDFIEAAADQNGVPYELLRRIAHVESAGDPTALSSAGAQGMFQVMPNTARSLGYSPADMYNPALAAQAAAKYMRQLYEQFGDWDHAVQAYNAGPTRFSEYKEKGRPLPKETKRYLEKIKGLTSLPMSGPGLTDAYKRGK